MRLRLIDVWDDMAALGVDFARISPQAQHTAEVVGLFDAVRRQTLSGAQAREALLPLLPAEDCNGYWHGQPGLNRVAPSAALATA